MYAIVDIETTGGKFNEERITEIAIYKYDGKTIVDQFVSLLNPEKKIQEFVVKLTGINDKMLIDAPKFHEVAKRVIEITENCIVVAHNASFDYRILRTAYSRLNYDYTRDTLCTIQLSKKLIPDQDSYSLGKLCKSLGIPVANRHRASGDALATVKLFKLLLDKDVDKKIIQKTIQFIDNRNYKLKVSKILEELPEKEGVFYVHNENGSIIFIGRGKNIRLEVNNLFLKNNKRAEKIKNKVDVVTYQETGNQLFTRLKYYLELDSIKPKYNLIRKRKLTHLDFNHDHFLIIEKGRIPEENLIILVERNHVVGYAFTNLSYQKQQLMVLKKLVTAIENKPLAKTIIKNYLLNNSVEKIVHYELENNL